MSFLDAGLPFSSMESLGVYFDIAGLSNAHQLIMIASNEFFVNEAASYLTVGGCSVVDFFSDGLKTNQLVNESKIEEARREF